MAVGVRQDRRSTPSVRLHTLNGHYGPSIAIGGVDLTAIDLAYGYAMLANGGVDAWRSSCLRKRQTNSRPVSILKVYDRSGNQIYDSKDHLAEKRVVDEQHAYMITSILTDPSGRVHHVRLRRHQSARTQRRGEDRHERALRPRRP